MLNVKKMDAIGPDKLRIIPFPQRVYEISGKPDSQENSNNILSWQEAEKCGILKEYQENEIKKARTSSEGYLLIVDLNKSRIKLVVGDTPRALQYGRVTAEKIVEFNNVKLLQNTLVILDWPDVPVRAANRTQMIIQRETENGERCYYEEGLRDIHAIFNRMVELKLNTFILHSGWGFGIKDILGDDDKRNSYVDEMVKSAQSYNIDMAFLLVHSMELESGALAIGEYTQNYCGTDPEIRKKRLRVFERIIRTYPEVKYFIVHNDEHPRCKCERCKKTSFGDEFLSYLHDYRELIRQRRPDAMLVAVPYSQLGFPGFHMQYLSGRWNEISDDICTFWWTETYTRYNLPQFLTEICDTFEDYVFDKLPHIWHWFYMNGWTDFTFPCPEHFRSWVRRGLDSGHVEGFAGEQAFYKGSEWNIRALSQFTWNSTLSIRDFDSIMLNTFFNVGSTEKGRGFIEGYRSLLKEFLASLYSKGYMWKEEGEPEVIKTLRLLLGKVHQIERKFKETLDDLKRKEDDMEDSLVDFQLDIAILRLEIKVRLNLRDAYCSWQKAENLFAENKKDHTTRQLNESLKFLNEAQAFWNELRETRIRRGNYHHKYFAAPMSKMERVFPDLIATTELTLRLREQGYKGFRPRWKEWIEIDNLWKEYHAFH